MWLIRGLIRARGAVNLSRMNEPLRMPSSARHDTLVPIDELPEPATPVELVTILTHMQALFVTEYRRDRNGTQAAIRAGYSPMGAAQCASRMLRVHKIANEIARRDGRTMRKFEITADTIAQEHASIAFADPNDPDTNLKFSDKRGSLDSLGRHLGMFIDKIDHSGTLTFEGFKERFNAPPIIDVTPDE